MGKLGIFVELWHFMRVRKKWWLLPLLLVLVALGFLLVFAQSSPLAPTYDFLDTYISIGLITPEERSSIVQESMQWTPDNQTRPIIIEQALPHVSYHQGTDPSWHITLQEVTQWALQQPTVEQ